MRLADVPKVGARFAVIVATVVFAPLFLTLRSFSRFYFISGYIDPHVRCAFVVVEHVICSPMQVVGKKSTPQSESARAPPCPVENRGVLRFAVDTIDSDDAMITDT